MPVEWREDVSLTAIARELVEQYHPHIIGYPLRIVFRSQSRKRGNRVTLGTAELITGRFAWFVMTDDEKGMEGQDSGHRMFWIEIAEDEWDGLSDLQRRALVDHELMHCTIEDDGDGGMVMTIADHDVEEFEEIVRRHGLWKQDLWNFGLAIAETFDPHSVTDGQGG